MFYAPLYLNKIREKSNLSTLTFHTALITDSSLTNPKGIITVL